MSDVLYPGDGGGAHGHGKEYEAFLAANPDGYTTEPVGADTVRTSMTGYEPVDSDKVVEPVIIDFSEGDVLQGLVEDRYIALVASDPQFRDTVTDRTSVRRQAEADVANQLLTAQQAFGESS